MNTRRAAVIVILVTLAALWPVARHEFTAWDDIYNIINNPHVNPPTLAGLRFHWTHFWQELYVPITYTAWIGLAKIAYVDGATREAALNPWLFHVANLIAHLIAAVMALRVLLRLNSCSRELARAFCTKARASSRLHEADPIAAMIGALVFAVHPVQVESVAWIAGLKDVLAGMFCLIVIDQYVAFALQAPRRRAHFAAAIIAYILAMLSKPSAVALPFILIAIDSLMLRRPWRSIARSVAMFFVLAIPIIIVGRIAQPPVLHVPMWQRPLIAGEALAFYLWKIVWPARLAIDYSHTPGWVMQSGIGYWAWIVPTIVLIAVIVIARRRGATIGLCAACVFLAAILPVLGFVPFEFQLKSTVADHYLYLPMFGIAMGVAGAMQFGPRWARTLGVVVVIALAIRSFAQTWHWRDSVTLFRHTASANPRSIVAHTSLFVQAMNAGDARAAERAARDLLQVTPDDMDAHLNLASALAEQKRFAEAESILRAAVHRWPDQAAPHLGLAIALTDLGRFDEAMAEYDAVARIDPKFPSLASSRARAERLRQSSTTQP